MNAADVQWQNGLLDAAQGHDIRYSDGASLPEGIRLRDDVLSNLTI